MKGCDAFASELTTSKDMLKRWIILKPCLCGSGQQKDGTQQVCKCNLTVTPLWGVVPVQFWPNLDWWALGGVDKLILCPDHKILVAHEIVRQQGLDPTMDSEGMRNPSNRH